MKSAEANVDVMTKRLCHASMSRVCSFKKSPFILNNIHMNPKIKQLVQKDLWIKHLKNRLKLVCKFIENNYELKGELLYNLELYGFKREYHYFSKLSPGEIRSLSFNTIRMDNQIDLYDNYLDLIKLLDNTFVKGVVYPKNEVKRLMQLAFKQLGINAAARASDLGMYIQCKEVKNAKGTRQIKIL